MVELSTQLLPTDDEDNDALALIAQELGVPVVATTGAHYAAPRSSRLAAAMAAVRGRRSLDEADAFLPPGPGAHLRSGAEMAALFARYPTAVPTAAAIGAGMLVRPAPGGAATCRPMTSRRDMTRTPTCGSSP